MPGNNLPQASTTLCEIINLETFFTHGLRSSRQKVLSIPVDVDAAIAERLREAAPRVCTLLECEGMGRVGFLLHEEGPFTVNEINTSPGSEGAYPYRACGRPPGAPARRCRSA